MKSFILAVASFVLCLSGCSMCCGPFDYDYPTFGGKHVRANRSHGRVGSILSDPISSLGGPSADSNLQAPPDPNNASQDDDDSIDYDLEDDSDIDSDGDGSESIRRTGADDELEPIEPLRSKQAGADDSTASTRWRPRPLR